MIVQSGIIAELEARHHKKEMDIKSRIDELNAVIIQTRDISEKATGVIQSLQDGREEAEEEYRHEVGKFEAYMKRKHDVEEVVGKDYTYEDAMRHIERDAIKEFFDD
jgi:hypothetical protein